MAQIFHDHRLVMPATIIEGDLAMTALFVLTSIVAFLAIDWFIHRSHARSLPVPGTAAGRDGEVRVPEGIFFSPSHTWMNLFPSGKIRLGVDDFITRLIKDPAVVLLGHPGDHIVRGDPVMVLKGGDHQLLVRSPIEGDILALNEDLAATPQLNRDTLYSDGWAYVVKPRRLSDVKRFMLGSESRAWVRHEFQRLKDLLVSTGRGVQPAYLQEGGPPVPGVLNTLDAIVWREIDRTFLNVE
jgi:glycine cleavage system H protein